MRQIIINLFIFNLCVAPVVAQSYTSYITGDSADVDVTPTRGIVLAGGATDNDNAMQWMLERANGGDVLVLRASGADGYNNYFFADLGVNVNSVETIVCSNAASGSDPYVLQRIAEAECIFFAGGNQSNYINFWLDTPVETALNDFILTKNGVIGGTSAGMAILGSHIFTAQNGTVTSNSALNNPFGLSVTLSHDDFLAVPFLQNVVTDTHYDNPDRRGRQMTFMAQMSYVGCSQPLGIACNEYVAVAIDANGVAYCFGEYPQYQEYVYFLRQGCESPSNPEVMEPLQALTWNRNQSALKVYRANARLDGSSTFNLNDWISTSGDGQWQNWYVDNGVFNVLEDMQAPDCIVTGIVEEEVSNVGLPWIFNNSQLFVHQEEAAILYIFDMSGRQMGSWSCVKGENLINLSHLASGVYAVDLRNANGQRIGLGRINKL